MVLELVNEVLTELCELRELVDSVLVLARGSHEGVDVRHLAVEAPHRVL